MLKTASWYFKIHRKEFHAYRLEITFIWCKLIWRKCNGGPSKFSVFLRQNCHIFVLIYLHGSQIFTFILSSICLFVCLFSEISRWCQVKKLIWWKWLSRWTPNLVKLLEAKFIQLFYSIQSFSMWFTILYPLRKWPRLTISAIFLSLSFDICFLCVVMWTQRRIDISSKTLFFSTGSLVQGSHVQTG